MKFFSPRFVALAALGGVASSSSAYAKETSASIIDSDSHIISALQATENPQGPGVRRQLRKLLVTAQKAKSESALRADAKSGVRHLQEAPSPTKAPKASKYATASPSESPSANPSAKPSFRPSAKPSAKPSFGPSASPSLRPSASPSAKPSAKPSFRPSASPSAKPSAKPSFRPSASPSAKPSPKPSAGPSVIASESPSVSKQPSGAPTESPSVSKQPSGAPTESPSVSKQPSGAPTESPSVSKQPSGAPTESPSVSKQPSGAPTESPSVSKQPSGAPTESPSVSKQPSGAPTESPSVSKQPSGAPTESPSVSKQPSGAPTESPSVSKQPSGAPTESPSVSKQPSGAPTPAPIVNTDSPTPTNQGGSFPVDECAATGDKCLCGTCSAENTCVNDNGSNKPEPICLKPTSVNSCETTDTLSVVLKPCKTTVAVYFNNEPGLCPDGWYIKSDASCPFVNNYEITSSSCVNVPDPVNIHASCSCYVALCTDFSGFVLAGYGVPNSNNWIVSGDNCASSTLQGGTVGNVNGCTLPSPPGPTTPSPTPTPSTCGGTEDGEQCSGNCDDCCSGNKVSCKGGGGKVCGTDASKCPR